MDARASAWPPAAAYGSEIPAAWFDLARLLVQTTPGFSPPIASRAFGYAGVALHDALVPGLSGRTAITPHVGGRERPARSGDDAYHWPTVANSALATILRRLFPTASSANQAAIDALEARFTDEARAAVPGTAVERSAARGVMVARETYEWSTTDGGHQGFARNFPPYVIEAAPGVWEPTPPGFSVALQPFWGQNRPFAIPSAEACSPGPPPPYSEDPSSTFYREAYEVYVAGRRLTPEQETIARFWSDDAGQTATPPGHSVSILTQVLRRRAVPLDQAAEAYAKVGMAVSDAFIACWWTKYRYNLLRPVSYIRRVIDPAWTPLLTTPPFPEYTSGHSAQSAAAAQVVTDLLGDVPFTDRTHEARGFEARSFSSFFDAAQEAAISRLYGGIHYRAGIERGIEQGIMVGRYVSAL